MKELDTILQSWGVDSYGLLQFLSIGLRVVFVIIIAFVAYWIAKKFLVRGLINIIGRTETKWDDLMFDHHFFNYFALFIVPLAIRLSLNFIGCETGGVIHKIVNVWGVISAVLLLSAIMDGINRIYDSYPISRNRPIKVFIQVLKVFMYCVAIIVIVADLINRDPMTLLMGLSAFAAVLMLVFKDSILGFVAGVQLIANKMVKIGDWIVMPSSNADGEVLEINLTTVKVQNWDKTISTIPTYKMVSESFINWCGMEQSGGRRIKRSVNIDVQSIHYLTPEELEELKKSDLIGGYIVDKLAELEKKDADSSTLLDCHRMTNIGIFREYMEVWMTRNPDISQTMTHMVRQLQPTATGLPLEIYCFSNRQQWLEYERVQSDLFDHLYAVLPLFGLRAFQYRTDRFQQ